MAEMPEPSEDQALLESASCRNTTDLSGFEIGSEAGGKRGPDITTHAVVVGRGANQLTIGISDQGGGYINQVKIAGIQGGTDLSGVVSSLYGRGGQASLRDSLHSGIFNPNQAGPNRYAGTIRPVLEVGGAAFGLELPRRPAALMGPGGPEGYDYIEHEDLFADDYPDDGGSTDWDGFADPDAAGQAGEVTSPFDYQGSYTNCTDVDLDGAGGADVTISCVRHRYAWAFIRNGRANMKQFGPGTPVWQPTYGADDISIAAPSGTHPSNARNMAAVERAWSIRLDTAIWTPAYRFYRDASGALVSQARTELVDGKQKDVFFEQYTLFEPGKNAKLMPDARLPAPAEVVAGSLVILSDSNDPQVGPALGFYFPMRGANSVSIRGVDCDGHTLYTDRRNVRGRLTDNPGRTSADIMNLVAYKTVLTGVLAPADLEPGRYEVVRGEVFILVGTPNQIQLAARAVEAAL